METFRRAGDAFLQFCCAGASIHVKGDAYDMMNVIEITHLDGVQADTIDELFVRPDVDELKELGLDFTTNFLKFKNRMKLIAHFF